MHGDCIRLWYCACIETGIRQDCCLCIETGTRQDCCMCREAGTRQRRFCWRGLSGFRMRWRCQASEVEVVLGFPREWSGASWTALMMAGGGVVWMSVILWSETFRIPQTNIGRWLLWESWSRTFANNCLHTLSQTCSFSHSYFYYSFPSFFIVFPHLNL